MDITPNVDRPRRHRGAARARRTAVHDHQTAKIGITANLVSSPTPNRIQRAGRCHARGPRSWRTTTATIAAVTSIVIPIVVRSSQSTMTGRSARARHRRAGGVTASSSAKAAAFSAATVAASTTTSHWPARACTAW